MSSRVQSFTAWHLYLASTAVLAQPSQLYYVSAVIEYPPKLHLSIKQDEKENPLSPYLILINV